MVQYVLGSLCPARNGLTSGALKVALSKTVFIDRSNRQTAMAAFDGAAQEMQRDKVCLLD